MGIQQEYKTQTMRRGFIVQKDSGCGYMYTSGKQHKCLIFPQRYLSVWQLLMVTTYLKCTVDNQVIHLET